MATEKRGSIAFSTTNRPPLPLDIFSCPLQPTSSEDELHMTDRKSYNYNGQDIPSDALVKILKYTNLAFLGSETDVNSGRLSGMIFVSERENLELLHISLHYNDNPPRVRVYSLAEVFRKFPLVFGGVRMEDSGCFASDHLIYVSTKEPASERRQPWTAVYKTKLKGGKTDRLTPLGHADLSPSVSPCGKKIAVASFQGKGGWDGEMEDLKTDIYVMNIEKPYKRRLVVKNGGWPTWGSENVIFFHRRDPPKYYETSERTDCWGVYRADISNSGDITLMRVTPDNIDAFTPAAIDATTVAVATQRQKKPKFQRKSVYRKEVPVEECRHIEIFYSVEKDPVQITQKTRPEADHFNPFVIRGGKCTRIGYHRCRSDETFHLSQSAEDITRQFQNVTSPDPDIGLFRVGGGLPTFSKDGSRLAFVDQDFKRVYVLENNNVGVLHMAYKVRGNEKFFSLVWSQNDASDELYLCAGYSLSPSDPMNIIVLINVSHDSRTWKQLTRNFNNAYPSTNPQGTRLVFRSTRDDGSSNLYILEDAIIGLYGGGQSTRLTNGPWIDTQCQWSPSGKWIVFSSNRDKPSDAPNFNNGFDPGYFSVYLVDPDNMDVCVRVIGSSYDLGGHVSHPCFSPDGRSIVVSSDLAAFSVDPISLYTRPHLVRPDGNMFTVSIDPYKIDNNKDVKMFNRITHSRYDDSGTWTSFSTLGTNEMRVLLEKIEEHKRHPLVHLLGGKRESK